MHVGGIQLPAINAARDGIKHKAGTGFQLVWSVQKLSAQIKPGPRTAPTHTLYQVDSALQELCAQTRTCACTQTDKEACVRATGRHSSVQKQALQPDVHQRPASKRLTESWGCWGAGTQEQQQQARADMRAPTAMNAAPNRQLGGMCKAVDTIYLGCSRRHTTQPHCQHTHAGKQSIAVHTDARNMCNTHISTQKAIRSDASNAAMAVTHVRQATIVVHSNGH